MAGGAQAILDEALKQRDKYWEGISERTRTLCLGTLVVIWGVFSQKTNETGLSFDAYARSALLKIAACAVVVLGLDFAEYLAAFQYRRQLSGDRVFGRKFRYQSLEKVMRFSKVVLGLITLVALCVVIGRVLSVPVHAQGTSADRFYGTWCGGDRQQGTWGCLKVTNPQGELVVEFTYQGIDYWITCDQVEIPQDTILNAVCGNAATENAWQNPNLIEMHITVGNYEDTRDLLRVP